MERMATSDFQELFTWDHLLDVDILIDMTQEKVTADMNTELCKEFTEEEISDALF